MASMGFALIFGAQGVRFGCLGLSPSSTSLGTLSRITKGVGGKVWLHDVQNSGHGASASSAGCWRHTSNALLSLIKQTNKKQKHNSMYMMLTPDSVKSVVVKWLYLVELVAPKNSQLPG